MNDQAQPSIWERSTTTRFFRWLFSWRGLRRILIVLVWTATIVALIYGEENWRGKRAWRKYSEALKARGEQIDMKAFIPREVPDEQNFAATPFVKSWFPKNPHIWLDAYSKAQSKVSGSKKTRSERQFTDLVAWEMAFDAIESGDSIPHQGFASGKPDPESRRNAAPAVLEALKDSEPNLTELRAASSRPYSRYPVVYDLDNPWGILLPHLATIKSAVVRLQLKACAELAAGQTNNAFDDVKLMLYLADSVKEEPFLISYLVRVACLQLAVQPIWEALAEHRWSDAQLQEIQTRLQGYDLLTDVRRPLNAERAAAILTAELLFRQKYRLSDLLGEPNSSLFEGTLQKLFVRIAPRGWYYQEQINYSRLFEKQLEGTSDPARRRVFPSQIELNAHELEREIAGGRLGKTLGGALRHRLLASLLLPALGNTQRRAAMGQTAVDQAALACALERYRVGHGKFPEKLEALVPQFISALPHDIITGEPYKYRPNEDGQFILYSVGWNEKDDGGMPGKNLFDEKQGDWVWHYP